MKKMCIRDRIKAINNFFSVNATLLKLYCCKYYYKDVILSLSVKPCSSTFCNYILGDIFIPIKVHSKYTTSDNMLTCLDITIKCRY